MYGAFRHLRVSELRLVMTRDCVPANCRINDTCQIRPHTRRHYVIRHVATYTIRRQRNSLFWDVVQHSVVLTDVSGQPISPTFKSQAVEEGCWTASPLRMGPKGCPEKSLSNKTRCITSQKSEHPIYTATEACYLLTRSQRSLKPVVVQTQRSGQPNDDTAAPAAIERRIWKWSWPNLNIYPLGGRTKKPHGNPSGSKATFCCLLITSQVIPHATKRLCKTCQPV
jgi:hypothetical protein